MMYKYRRAIISVIALLLVVSLLAGFVVMLVNAKTSSEIQAEIDELEKKSDELASQREDLENEILQNENQTLDLVQQKSQVDRDIELTRQEIELVNEQIHQYNLLISEKQAELDELKTQQDDLFERYKLRMRTMQERGEATFWSVLLEADSFADMLNCRTMIEEIAKTDQRMMDEMRELSAQVLEAKESLAQEKIKLGETKAQLNAAEEALDEKRAESDTLLAELNANRAELIEAAEKYEEEEAALSDQIAALEAERTEVLRQEWLAAHPPATSGGSNGSGDSSAEVDYPASNESFLFPVDRSGFAMYTSTYGWRVHPITGSDSFHNGLDLACYQGTPIYASRSGTVTTATYNYAYGYYVIINHYDGFSTLYGHMTNYVVSAGDFVERGQVIGYVGSTGYSTGPHLHFTIYKNDERETVNPAAYIS